VPDACVTSQDGLPHGNGRMEFANGAGTAEGMWAKGKMEGRGKRVWGAGAGPNGYLSYEGEFKGGEMYGKGVNPIRRFGDVVCQVDGL
jgi:hypothetical protein